MPIEFKTSVNKNFFNKLKKVSEGQVKAEAPIWLEEAGIELLRIVGDEIIRRQVVDTRLLLNSFEKDGAHNIWRTSDNGMTVEVGSSLHYAKYVNDGHWTNPKGVAVRFVPGEWHGEHFEYIPGAKTGMVLKQKWVDAQPYWDSAMDIWGKMFPKLVNTKFRQWIRKYF